MSSAAAGEGGGGWEDSGQSDEAKRSRKRTKQGVYTSDVTVEDLSRHFHQPASKACQELGMGLTIFKRVCRKLGLQRWPYEKPGLGRSDSGGQQLAHMPTGGPQLSAGFAGGGSGGAGGSLAASPAQRQWQAQPGGSEPAPVAASVAAGYRQPPDEAGPQSPLGASRQQQQQPQQQVYGEPAGAPSILQRSSASRPGQVQPQPPFRQQGPSLAGGWIPSAIAAQPASPRPSGSPRPPLRGIPVPPVMVTAGQGPAPAPPAAVTELMAAAAQVEAVLQQGGDDGRASSALRSGSMQRLAEVLVADSVAAQELLGAIAQAISRHQQHQQQKLSGQPQAFPQLQHQQLDGGLPSMVPQRQAQLAVQVAEHPAVHVAPGWHALQGAVQLVQQAQPRHPQAQGHYATSQPLAVLQQQCHLPANLLVQQQQPARLPSQPYLPPPVPQQSTLAQMPHQAAAQRVQMPQDDSGDQVAAMIGALRWVMQHPEEQQQTLVATAAAAPAAVPSAASVPQQAAPEVPRPPPHLRLPELQLQGAAATEGEEALLLRLLDYQHQHQGRAPASAAALVPAGAR